jgi:hypothetical protein
MAIEPGLTLTIVERDSPHDAPSHALALRRAERIWLGPSSETEWLYREANRRIGAAASGWFDITMTRTSRHYGAGGETTEILINLPGASIAAKVVSDLIDYAKAKLRERSSLVDQQAIDDDSDSVNRIAREVADIAQVDSDRIVPLIDTRTTSEMRRLEYRDVATGDRYEVEIKRQEIIVVRHAPN